MIDPVSALWACLGILLLAAFYRELESLGEE